jgi:hypothetical protein
MHEGVPESQRGEKISRPNTDDEETKDWFLLAKDAVSDVEGRKTTRAWPRAVEDIGEDSYPKTKFYNLDDSDQTVESQSLKAERLKKENKQIEEKLKHATSQTPYFVSQDIPEAQESEIVDNDENRPGHFEQLMEKTIEEGAFQAQDEEDRKEAA